MAECGIPRELGTNTTQVGTNHYGGDGVYRSLTADCLPLLGGYWNYGAGAGVFARYLHSTPGFSSYDYGARAVRLLAAV
jgi:hypothetical protein